MPAANTRLCASRVRPLLPALIALLGLLPGAACAQAYPAKTIRFLVSFPPGGTSDILARIIGQKLAESWGVQVVIDNRPGAGGNIGAELAAKAPPDGHTLLMGTTSHAIGASLYRNLPYDILRDLAPVAKAVNYANMLVVHPSVPARSVRELIAIARTRPGQLVYGTPGNGTPPHLTGEMFKSMTGTSIVHIPYKGGAPAIADLLGGHTGMMFDNVPPLHPHVKSGKLRALGVTSLRRVAALPEVPTLDESGVKGFESVAWNGVFVPAGTPREIIARLAAEVTRILQQPDIRERLASQGAEPDPTAPDAFAAHLRAEVTKWARVIKESGARID
jgi:tripartite-type tricarboxylate transporter receptor subunit TctC